MATGQAGKRDFAQANKVVSIEDARLRLARRGRPRTQPLVDEHFDLEGVDFERMGEEAREYFWFNVNSYARDLAQRAAAYSDAEGERADGAVTPYHVEAAEAQRLVYNPAAPRFGLGFALDAVQLIGAAVCGALVAQPGTTGGAGFVAFAFALMITVGTFLLRQTLPGAYTNPRVH